MKPLLIFVITPIGKKGTETYKKYDAIFKTMIKPAVDSVDPSFRIIRADHIGKPGSFIKDILEHLQSSFIVIANLTGLNPNVFYELGVRHTLSKRTIMITEDLESLPSDLKEYRAIEYKPDITAVEEFKLNLSKTIEEILRNPDHPDNPVQDRLPDIVKSREESYKKDIDILRTQLSAISASKKKGKGVIPVLQGERTKKRLDRILSIWNAKEQPGVFGVSWTTGSGENKTEYHVPSPSGNFGFYFIGPGRSIEYALVISMHDQDFDIEADLADVRVMISQYQNTGNMDFKFVIATNSDLTKERAKINKFFKNALQKVEQRERFRIEVWDQSELLKIEKELGLKM